MKKKYIIPILLLLCLLQAAVCYADTFKGKVVNSETGESLAKASVYWYVDIGGGRSQSATFETDSLGCFEVHPDYPGKIIFTCSMLGFKSAKKVNYALGADNNDIIDLGLIRLRPTELMLKEVQVTAKIPRITMSGDTLVFNPMAFKLKEGARLEELIAKLPGVQRRDGKLYWNNHPLRLVINGRNVFGGDGLIGELPADVAAKMKIYDRKSEASRHTGRDDAQEDHVLDIQVKPGLLDKWYGELEGEYRTKDHYRGKLNANRLSASNPQMVYFQANDVNLMVNHQGSNISNSYIDKFGKSLYGAYNYERDWTKKGLENYDNNRFYITGMMGHTDGWGSVFTNRETFLPDADHTFEMSRNNTSSHSLAPKLATELFAYTDSFNSIKVNATATFEKKRGTNETNSAKILTNPSEPNHYSVDELMNAKGDDETYRRMVTRSRYYTSSEATTRKIDVDYNWTHYYGQKGWFALYGTTSASGVYNRSSVNRQIEYPMDGQKEYVRQFSKNPLHNFRSNLTAQINYYLHEKLLLRMSDDISYSKSHDKNDYYADNNDFNQSIGVPTSLDENNRKDYDYKGLQNTVYLNLVYMPTKNVYIMPTVRWFYNHEKANMLYGRLDSTMVKNRNMVWPYFWFRWNISRAKNLLFEARYETQLVDPSQSFAYRNTVDPLFVVVGNPNLKNPRSFFTYLNYEQVWLRKQINLSFLVKYYREINPLTKLYRYNTSTGVYQVTDMNAKTGDSWQVDVTYDHSIGAYWRVKNTFSVAWLTNYGYMTLVNDAAELQVNRMRRRNIVENLQVDYESDNVKFGGFANMQALHDRYTQSSSNSNPFYINYGLWARLTMRPFEFAVSANDTYSSNYNIDSMNGHQWVCSASVDYRFYKNKCCLSLGASDIFNQQKFYGASYTAQERMETWYDTQHHYLSLTFTYKFDAKAKK